MENYECSCCKFLTNSQFNFKRHLATKKHISRSEVTKNQPEVTNNQPEVTNNLPIESKFNCKYCNKSFTLKNAMYRHEKHRCPKKVKEQKTQINNIQIDNRQINIHFNLLPYKNTDTSHLTDEDFIQCVKQHNCVKHLIEKIHFNPTKPENMNIIISNLKDKYMRIYDGEWRTVPKNQLNKIYGDKEDMICEWIEEEKYPKLKDRYEAYLTQKEDAENLNEMKEEIKLMVYNQKKLTIGE